MHCLRIFRTHDALDNQFHQTYKITEEDLTQCTSKGTCNHPFTMIVGGPTRSGKTTWAKSSEENQTCSI